MAPDSESEGSENPGPASSSAGRAGTGPSSGRSLLGAVLLVVAFWAVAATARYFVDAPFAYVFGPEWVSDLVESKARFPSPRESALHLVAAVFLLPAVLLGAVWASRRERDPLERIWGSLEARPHHLALVFAALAALGAAFVCFGLIQGADILDDERAYRFQAELFAQGKLALPSVPAAFRNPMLLTSPTWTAKYPPGHALTLVLGVLLGEPRVVPILVTALTVLGVYHLMRPFGPRQALLASALFAASPFAWCIGATLTSFSTTACALTWFFALVVRAETDTGKIAPFAAGVCLGWASLTRPYDAAALALPLATWLAVRALRGERRSTTLAVALGALPFVGLQLAYNRAITGSAWQFPYWGTSGFHIGFTQSLEGFPYVHSPAQALAHAAVAAIRLDRWLLVFPCSLLFVLVAALRRDKTQWDWVLLASLGSFLVFYSALPSSGTWDVGPTYYFVATPLLVALAVRGGALARREASARWPALGRTASAWLVVGPLVGLCTITPLNIARLTKLASEIRAPWDAVASSGIGDAIVIVPSHRQRFAAGYALGYPYEVSTGPGTRARLVEPHDEAELREAHARLGADLPVFALVVDQRKAETSGIRSFQVVPFGATQASP